MPREAALLVIAVKSRVDSIQQEKRPSKIEFNLHRTENLFMGAATKMWSHFFDAASRSSLLFCSAISAAVRL
jgi:hypothetical protein